MSTIFGQRMIIFNSNCQPFLSLSLRIIINKFANINFPMVVRIKNLSIKIDSIWMTQTQNKMDRKKFGMTFLGLTTSTCTKLRVVWPTNQFLDRTVLGGPSSNFAYIINTTIATNLYPQFHLTLSYMKVTILETLEEVPHELWYPTLSVLKFILCFIMVTALKPRVS